MLKHLSLPLLFLLVGAALRFHALSHDARFHPDEALFATFARKAAVNGDWLLHGALDKTPLTIYANAISMMLVGVRPLPDGVLTLDIHAGEFAARVPGTLASIVLIAVIYALAKRLYPSHSKGTEGVLSLQTTPLIAAMLMAVSPYALAFSATAFTDGLMLLCLAVALLMASRGRWGWAGVWLAIGYGCKQQALLYAPLVVGVGYTLCARTRSIVLLRSMILFSLPVVAGFGLLAAWDAARAQEISPWTLALANNDPGRFIYPDEAIPRLRIWGDYAGYWMGPPWLTALFLATGLLGAFWRTWTGLRERQLQTGGVLLVYATGYLVLHWLVALPTHDRYLLPLLPLVILLAARGTNTVLKITAAGLKGRKSKVVAPLGLSVLVLCCFPTAYDATQGHIAVGGDRGKHDGIDRLGAYLDSKPLGTIVYDYWLGWELGYYLGTWSNKRLTYYPHAGALAADAAAQSDPAPRYFPAPTRAGVEPWLNALAAAGFKIDQDYRSPRFIVYRLIPPSAR